MDRSDIEHLIETLRAVHANITKEIQDTSKVFMDSKKKLEDLDERGISVLKTLKELEQYLEGSQ